MFQVEKSLTITINQKAPEIHTTDIFERELKLSDFRGKKVFLGFFRHAGCPFCNYRIHTLQQNFKRLNKLGLEMIFFFESSKETLLSESFHKQLLPIPTIADPDHIWYDTFGVGKSVIKFFTSQVTSLIPAIIKAKRNDLPVDTISGTESYTTMPAEFLIDEDGIIRKIHYAKSLNDRMSVDLLREFAQRDLIIN